MNFPQYLEEQFLAWQSKQGKRRTISEFADYLGVAQTTASSWLNGTRAPEGENLRKLAHKLGIEVYDALGLPRPDPDLLYIQAHWDEFDDEFKKSMRNQAEQYRSENEAKKSKRKRTANI